MRRLVLTLALGGTLVATYFAPRQDGAAVVEAAPHRARGSAAGVDGAKREVQSAAASLDLTIRPRRSNAQPAEVFGSQTWAQPEAAAPILAQAAPPPEAQAPPLPFHFLGRVADNGQVSYFLQFNERNLVVKPGDTIEQTYVLDGFSDGTLTFTYLPLKTKQTLVVGELN